MAIREFLKNNAKKILSRLGIYITRNQKYDHLTLQILKKELHPASHVVDIGCHKGEFLEDVLRLAPKGRHMAFEPLPDLAKILRRKFHAAPVVVWDVALAAENGISDFVIVPEAPAYSGLRERTYPSGVRHLEKIQVQVRRLDDVLPPDYCPHLIKIDVEGAEWEVLKGAENILRRCHPVLLFEFGRGASDQYGVGPEILFPWLQEKGYSLYTLNGYLLKNRPLSASDFEQLYFSGREYYFVARA